MYIYRTRLNVTQICVYYIRSVRLKFPEILLTAVRKRDVDYYLSSLTYKPRAYVILKHRVTVSKVQYTRVYTCTVDTNTARSSKTNVRLPDSGRPSSIRRDDNTIHRVLGEAIRFRLFCQRGHILRRVERVLAEDEKTRG